MKARHAARGERRRRYRSRRDCTATARRCGRACAFAPAARGGRDLSAGGRARGNTTSTRHRDSPPRAPRRLGRRRALPQSRALVGVAGARSRPRPAARARTASAASAPAACPCSRANLRPGSSYRFERHIFGRPDSTRRGITRAAIQAERLRFRCEAHAQRRAGTWTGGTRGLPRRQPPSRWRRRQVFTLQHNSSVLTCSTGSSEPLLRIPLLQRIYCGHGITRSHTAERLTFRSRAERGDDLVERLLRVTKKHLGVGLEEDGVVGPGVPAPRARARAGVSRWVRKAGVDARAGVSRWVRQPGVAAALFLPRRTRRPWSAS